MVKKARGLPQKRKNDEILIFSQGNHYSVPIFLLASLHTEPLRGLVEA